MDFERYYDDLTVYNGDIEPMVRLGGALPQDVMQSLRPLYEKALENEQSVLNDEKDPR